jgi:hypothetical protein
VLTLHDSPTRLPDTGLLVQAAELRRLHPTLSTEACVGRLGAEGVIRGNALTARYRIRIEYALGGRPRAFVLDPIPQRRHPCQPVIHTNGADNEPCLFTLAHHDWRPTMSLARSIVPWLMEWLIFYEAWYLTGYWQGGGDMPAWYDALAVGEASPTQIASLDAGSTVRLVDAVA